MHTFNVFLEKSVRDSTLDLITSQYYLHKILLIVCNLPSPNLSTDTRLERFFINTHTALSIALSAPYYKNCLTHKVPTHTSPNAFFLRGMCDPTVYTYLHVHVPFLQLTFSTLNSLVRFTPLTDVIHNPGRPLMQPLKRGHHFSPSFTTVHTKKMI